MSVDRRAVVGGLIAIGSGPLVGSAVAMEPPAAAPAAKFLPSLPLPKGARVAGFGHSMIAQSWFSWYANGEHLGTSDSNMQGVLPWIRFWDQRFDLSAFFDLHNPFQPASRSCALTGAAQGLSGDHISATPGATPGLLNRVSYVLSLDLQIVYIHIGTNDINGGWDDASSIIAAYDQLLTTFYNAGVWVVMQTEIGRRAGPAYGLWAADDPRRLALAQLDAWIVHQAARPGVKVCDTREAFNVPHEPDVNLLATDGVHLSATGSYTIAKTLLPILQSMVSEGSLFDKDASKDNRVRNAALAGTRGERVNVEGTIADGWRATRRTGGSRYIASKQQATDGGFKQVFSIHPKDDFTYIHTLRVTMASDLTLEDLGLVPGDWFEIATYLELNEWNGWASIGQYNEFFAAPVMKWTDSTGLGNLAPDVRPLPTAATSGWVMTRSQIPEGRAIDRMRCGPLGRFLEINHDSRRGGEGVLKFSRPIFRKIDDPRGAWNLS